MGDGEALSPQPPPASTSVSLELPLSPQRGRHTMLTACRVLAAFVAAALCASSAAGYSFNIASSVQQCQAFTVNINGQGSPPFSLLLLPIDNSTQTSIPTLYPFNTSTSLTVPILRYAATTELIAVVSIHHIIYHPMHAP